MSRHEEFPYHEQINEGMTLLHMLQHELSQYEMNNQMVRLISGYEGSETIDDAAILDTAIENIDKHFEFVGLVERMSESVDLLAGRLKWKMSHQVPLLNVNSSSEPPEIDAETRAAIEKYNRLDIMLYEHVESTFAASPEHDAGNLGKPVMDEAGFYFKRFPRKLNLGCGFDVREGYLNIDPNGFHGPDLIADVRDLEMLPSGYYEEIIAEEVLEHIPRKETKRTLLEWNRLLRTNGMLKIRVPNLIGLVSLFAREEYQTIGKQEELVQRLFGTQNYEGDSHCTVFTEMLLRYYLNRTGFLIADMSVRDEWLFDVVARKRDFRELLDISDHHEFVVWSYMTILGRDPDRGGLDFYLSKLENGEMTRELVVRGLVESEEGRNSRSLQVVDHEGTK